jgi:hypothetical protein
MRNKKIYLLLLLIIVLTYNSYQVKSNEVRQGLRIGISAGLAIPNEQVTQFFDEARHEFSFDSLRNFGYFVKDKAVNVGYNFEIEGRIELSNHFTLVPSFGIARFSQGTYTVELPYTEIGDTAHLLVKSTANIIPISVGLNGYLFKSIIGVYATANLAYNYISYSYDIGSDDYSAIPISTSDAVSRLGYGFGAGVDISLGLVTLNLEAKFNSTNIIKMNSVEPSKNYGVFSVGVVF